MSRVVWDDDLEAAVLGAALTHPDAARLVVERCSAADFYLDTNRLVLREVARLVAAGERPDVVVVALAAEREQRPHILSLPSRCANSTNARLYVEWLGRVAARRRLASAMERSLDAIDQGLPADLRAELVAAASDERVEVEPWA